jgi:hypothetical protein
MKTKSISIFVIVFAFLIIYLTNAVGAIPATYSVSSNWHGINTPIGSTVIVTAVTTDNTVYNVTFLWHLPVTNLIVFTDTVLVSFNGTAYIATSTHVVLTAGDWGVQALFQSPTGTRKEGVNKVTATRATSFNVVPPNNQVPETPIIGTAGATGAMLLGGGLYFWSKRKHQMA